MATLAMTHVRSQPNAFEEFRNAGKRIINDLLKPLVFPIRVVLRAMFEPSRAQDQIDEARLKTQMQNHYPRF